MLCFVVHGKETLRLESGVAETTREVGQHTYGSGSQSLKIWSEEISWSLQHIIGEGANPIRRRKKNS